MQMTLHREEGFSTFQSGGPALVLSERRVNSPESWENCFSQLPNYWAFRFLETIIGFFGLCLGLLGTGMLAIIAQAIKIPE